VAHQFIGCKTAHCPASQAIADAARIAFAISLCHVAAGEWIAHYFTDSGDYYPIFLTQTRVSLCQ
jgi:hypothetical protein